MKKLNQLIDTTYDIEIKDIKINSKEVKKGDLFICVDKGTSDRHLYIDDAISNGASAVIVAKDITNKSVPIIKVDNPNEEFIKICSKFYDEPEKKLNMIGVTGTDGKTTTTTIIQTLLGNNKCGYIGTNGYNCINYNGTTDNTTPDSDILYKVFDNFLKQGCKYVSMEVSSEALLRHRVDNIKYDLAILTNITSEHLNSHGTLENYVNCKCQLFKQVKDNGICILNKDDEHYNEVYNSCKGTIYTYGKDSNNDFYFKDVKILPNKTLFKFAYKDKEYDVISPLLGMFNVYNLSAALLALLSLGFDYDKIKENIKYIKVDGRLEIIDMGQNYHVIVDFAHTTNGIYRLLEFVKTLPVNRIITVVGQAGLRDKTKRCKVGKVVSDNSDIAIFTYEDPRTEDPVDIINDMIQEIKKTNYKIIVDRKEAIKYAIDIACENDIVLILGKGNDTYEILKNGTIPFNDIEECKKDINARLSLNLINN